MDKVAIFDSLSDQQVYGVQSKLFKRLADKTSLKFDGPPILVNGMIGNHAYLPGKGTWEDTPHNVKVMNQHYTNSAKIDRRIGNIIRRNEADSAISRGKDLLSRVNDNSVADAMQQSMNADSLELKAKLDTLKLKKDQDLFKLKDYIDKLKSSQQKINSAKNISRAAKLMGIGSGAAAIGLGVREVLKPKPNVLMRNKGKAALAVGALIGAGMLAKRGD